MTLQPVVSASVTQYCDGHSSFPYDSWYSDHTKVGGPYQAMGVHVLDFFRALMGNVR